MGEVVLAGMGGLTPNLQKAEITWGLALRDPAFWVLKKRCYVEHITNNQAAVYGQPSQVASRFISSFSTAH